MSIKYTQKIKSTPSEVKFTNYFLVYLQLVLMLYKL